MTRDEILDKIRKVQALALKSTGGEQESAEVRLKEMMEKYGITLEELGGEEKETAHFYQYHGHRGRELFAQVAATRGCTRFVFMGNEDHSAKAKYVRSMTGGIRPRGTNVALVCTPILFIEITTAYEIYQRSFDEHMESLFYAFLNANDLFYGKADPNKKLTDEELKMLNRASLMSLGVERAEIHKQLGTGQ